MPDPKVLVVDDEPNIVQTLRLYLEKDGFRVVAAYDGRTALDIFERESPDLIVLDLMLPEISGLDLCRSIRGRSQVPIIMLTARSEEIDRIVGLELGADDYVTKPFSPREVAARVRAVLRRASAAGQEPAAERLVTGKLVVDLARHEVLCDGMPVALTPTEFRLLATLAGRPGNVYTRSQLAEAAQGLEFESYDRTVDSHIKNLRKKLGAEAACRITTVHGVGYKLEDAQEEPP